MVRRGKPTGRWLGIGVLVGVLWLGAATPLAAQEAPHPLELTGFQPGRGYLSVLPWEGIDVFSGSVILSATDLVLPGNSGLDLKVTRVFNSKGAWRWRIGIGPTVFDPPEPVPNPWGFWSNPQIWGVDGSEQPTFETSTGSGVFLTTGYARYTRSTRTLQEPDGRSYIFEESAEPGYLRLRQIADVFGNTIDVYYDAFRIRAVQHLGAQQERVVSLLHDTLGRVTTVSYSSDGLCEDASGQPITGRPCARWLYAWSENGDTRTLAVTPPIGPGWLIESTSAAGVGTVTVTTPNGGRVAYDFGFFPYPARKSKGSGIAYTRKLTARRSADRGVDYDPLATWTFGYPGLGHSETVVQGPTRRVRYVSGETGNTTTYLATELVYAPEDTAETTLLGKTEYAYRPIGSQVPGSPGPVGLVPAWPDPWDPEIVRSDPYPLLLSQVTRSRPRMGGGMRDYVRQFRYCGQTDPPGLPGCAAEPTNDAGRPIRMIETGDFVRTTAMTYRHAFGPGVYLRGVPTSQAVTVGTETFATTDTHTDLGFLESRNQFGTVTTYAPTDAGNVASVTNARQYTTSLTYEWGVRKNTVTPEYPIQREINPDGTVHSVTQNGATTTFQYDVLGRQTQIDPPLGADTSTLYAEDGTWVKVARGTSWTRTDLDGFGRAVGTVNSQGVHTATGYDTLGRTRWVRAPWDAAHPEDRRTWFEYDVWDRVVEKKNPDDSTVRTAYTADDSGLLTTITDENGHATAQRWHASGSPDDARLQAVTDDLGHATSYTYNALGSLTTVTSPGGVVRTWVYNTKNQLASQIQPEFGTQGEPELGTVTYHYDAVGNVQWQTDAEGRTTSYDYDGNNRLTLVTSPDAMYSTTISYDDANNRTSMSNGYVSTTFVYDEANRLTQRTDALNNRTFVSGYTFDDNGNVIDVQYPSGNHVEYGYDSENRVTSISDPARGLTFANTIAYHPAGGLAGYTSGDGVARTIDYDSRARPFRIAAAGVLDLRYQDDAGQPGYDAAGNLTSLRDALRPDRNATFTYDALDRLTTANGGGWGALTYSYDALGNRIEQIHTTPSNTTTTAAHTYTDHQRMQITGEASLWYDKNGNLIQDANGTYAYTPTNMLKTAWPVAGAVYTYLYDGDNQRALTFQGSTKTTYYLRGLGQVLSEFEEEGQQLRWTLDQVYVGSQLLAATRPPAGTTVLTVGKAGAGAGTVTSTPNGIDCGPACGGTTGAFPGGTVVWLTATPAAGWVFVGWSGELDCADGVVTLTDPKTCVATFALTAPLFAKQAPLSGGTTGTRRVTLQWAAAPNASYEVCWDTTDNGVCDTAWHWNATATRRVVEFATNGTYSWQVRTFSASPTEADDGAWWSVTVNGPPLFTKITPGNGAGGLGTTVTLQWTPVPNEGYAVCWDTSDNGTCDSAWWPNGGGTARVLEGLSAGTYYWQVRTAGGAVLADNGAWHAFTVATAALFSKQAPGNGATGLGSTVTLQWGAVPDEGYWVCWDTNDNGTCDSAWWPNGGATARVLEGLSAGTYYWQVKTAGGGVLADNGAWHHFTVGAEPAAMSTAGTAGGGASGPASAEHRSRGGAYAGGVAGAAGLTLMVLLAGPRRRRRVVAAGVMVCVLAPAAALAQTTTQVVEYYTTDAIGSVRAVTKNVGTGWQVTHHDFMPFGEEVSPPYPPPDKRLFTGKERDTETGLDYFEARYLRASAGRFTTVDPLMEEQANLLDPQQWNRYTYVRNNPLRFTDPDGKLPVAVAAAIPGPQQPFVVAAVVIGAAVVVAESPSARKAFREGLAAGAELLGRGISAARELLSVGEDSGNRSGGGKTGRKLNEDRQAAAEQRYRDAKKAFEEADRKPNKSPEDKARRDQHKKEMEHWQRKMGELSEEHARKAQGK